ncbi:MAG: DUF3105 domain-containing protein [Acidimicrobiia bacterium]
MTRRRRGSLAALALVLLAACGGGDDDSDGGSGSGATTTADPAVAALGDRVQRFLVRGNSHVPGRVDYPQTPPVGGDHNATWQNCGFYSSPVVSELAVHSMEHGAVWIVFRPSLPSDQVALLRQLAQRPYVLVSPWVDEEIPTPVVASAWGLQLRADAATDPAVAAFVQAYANGPQTPERGAPCTGAFGSPE